MDPQHRLLLEITMKGMRRVKTIDVLSGVYVGIQHMEYKGILERHTNVQSSYTSTSSSFAVAAGRISYTFSFTGPSMSIDTACSSALVSLACGHSYTKGSGQTSLSNSASMMLSMNTSMAVSAAGMTCPDGRCKALDISADGYGRSEACCNFILTTDANESGCIILAISTNQDGRSSSLTAPSGPAQLRLIQNSIDRAGVSPDEFSHIVLHGTGTSLGDPIEFGALNKIFPPIGNVNLSAPKTKYGHAEPASGHIGSHCALQILQSGATTTNLHLTSLNRHVVKIGFQGFSIGREVSGSRRQSDKFIIGVSAFAFQGTNSNAIFSDTKSDERDVSRNTLDMRRSRFWAFPSSVKSGVKAFIGKEDLVFNLDLFRSDDFACSDHIVNHRKVLPFALLVQASSEVLRTLHETDMAIVRAVVNSMTIMDQLESIGLVIRDSSIRISSQYSKDMPLEIFNCNLRRSGSGHEKTVHDINIAPSRTTLISVRMYSFTSLGSINDPKTGNICNESAVKDCIFQVSSAFSTASEQIRYPVSQACSTFQDSAPGMIWATSLIKRGSHDSVFCDYIGRGDSDQWSNMVEEVCFKQASAVQTGRSQVTRSLCWVYKILEEALDCTNAQIMEYSSVFSRIEHPKYCIQPALVQENQMAAILQVIRERRATEISIETVCSPGLRHEPYHASSRFIGSIMNELNQDVHIVENSQRTRHEFHTTRDDSREICEKGGTIFGNKFQRFAIENFDGECAKSLLDLTSFNIVGGSGSIGQLVTLWISEMTGNIAKSINVFGRQMRRMNHHLVASPSLIKLIQGDQSTSAESLAQCTSNNYSQRVNFLVTGVSRDMYFMKLTPADLRATIAPKSDCLNLMLGRSYNIPVILDLIFSSMVATFFNVGQSNYCVANSIVNETAQIGRMQGRNITSIEWGPWVLGMAEGLQNSMAKHGLAMITPDQGLNILNHAIYNTFGRIGDAIIGAYVEEVDSLQRSHGDGQMEHGVQARVRLISSKEAILDGIRKSLKEVLGFTIPDQQQFMEAGLDSIGSIEFRNKIVATVGIDLPPTVAFDYPSILSMAEYISSQYGSMENKIMKTAGGYPSSSKEEKVFIRSLSFRLPKSQQSTFVSSRVNVVGEDLITQVPLNRWDIERHFNTENLGIKSSYTRFSGFCEKVFDFDVTLFGLSTQESCWLDPQIRLLLEDHIQHLNEDIKSSGVYIGCMYHEYLTDLPEGSGIPPPHAIIGNGAAYMAGRVSYSFGMMGASMCTDTACSSSLVACGMASASIHNHESSLNFVSGINLLLVPSTTSAICHLNALSKSGRCLTFSENADGYGRAEGCIVISLIPSSNVANTSLLVCELKAISINQDGRSSALTSPNGPAQTQLIVSTCLKANIASSEVEAVSTHGTGTLLGDPIEVNSITNAYQGNKNISLIASKSCTGHTEGSAGLGGLLFALYPILNGSQPPILHLRILNKFITRSIENWSANVRLNKTHAPHVMLMTPVAGCSSFGMSGINAHALISDKFSLGGEIVGIPNHKFVHQFCHIFSTQIHNMNLSRTRQIRFDLNAMQLSALTKSLQPEEVAFLALLYTGVITEQNFNKYDSKYKGQWSNIALKDCTAARQKATMGTSISSIVSPDGKCEIVGNSITMWQSQLTQSHTRTIISWDHSVGRCKILSTAGEDTWRNYQPGHLARWDVMPNHIHVPDDLLCIVGAFQINGMSLNTNVAMISYLSDGGWTPKCPYLGADDLCTTIKYSKNRSLVISGFSNTMMPTSTDDNIYAIEYLFGLHVEEKENVEPVNLKLRMLESQEYILSQLAELLSTGTHATSIDVIDKKRVTQEHTIAPSGKDNLEGLAQGYISGFLRNLEIESPSLRVIQRRYSYIIKSSSIEASNWMGLSRRMRREPRHDQIFPVPVEYGMVITGGTGDIASALASWHANLSSTSLYLPSRSGRFKSKMSHLTRQSSLLVVQSLDLSMLGDAQKFQDQYRDVFLKVQFMHASGTQIAASMVKTSPTIARLVASSKVKSLLSLVSVLRPTQSGLLFSSISSILGSKENASYAAANAALDNLAEVASASGLNMRSVQWGAWAVIGMASRQANLSKQKSIEVGMISVDEGIRAVQQMLSHIYSTVTIVAPPIYWLNVAKVLKSVERLIEDAPFQHETVKQAMPSIKKVKHVISPDSIISVIKEVLEIASLDMETSLGQQGLESLSSLELKSRLDTLLAPRSIALDDLIIESPNGLLRLLNFEPSLPYDGDIPRGSQNMKIKMRLFCLPWAGGVSDNLFGHWDRIFPTCIEICPVQIPGRGKLSSINALESISKLSDHLINSLPLDEMPYAIFGTCLGAIVAYDMIQKLENSDRRKPIIFFPAAVSPPDKYSSVITKIYSPKRSIFSYLRGADNVKKEVLRRLQNWKSLPKDEVLYAFEAGHFAGIEEMKNSDLLYNRVAPIAVHDIMMAVNYEYQVWSRPVSMPIIAFDGVRDNTIPKNYMKGWQKHSEISFERVLIDSNHYFVSSHYLEVACKCSQECLAALNRSDPILPRKHSWVSDGPNISPDDHVITTNNFKANRRAKIVLAAILVEILFLSLLSYLWQWAVRL